MTNTSLLDGLRNTVRYDQREFPFTDNFAQFAVSFAAPTLGVGPVLPKATLSIFQIARAAGELWLEQDGQLLAMPRLELECLPWLAVERAVVGGLAMEARHFFAHTRRLVSTFTFTNRGSRPCPIAPRWLGAVSGETEPHYHLKLFDVAGVRETFLEKAAQGIRGGLRGVDGNTELPQAALALRCVSPAVPVWLGEEPFWANPRAHSLTMFRPGIGKTGFYALNAGRKQTLSPGESVTFVFSLDVALTYYQHPHFRWLEPLRRDADIAVLEKKSAQRFVQNIRAATPPATGNPVLDQKLLRARYALLRDGARGLDGQFGNDIACLCITHGAFSCVFFWDSIFSSVALSDFHPAYARGAIATVLANQTARDGAAECRKWNYPVAARSPSQPPMAPIVSWALTEYLKKNPDPAFLRRMYPRLTANHRYWEQFSDTDRDGLAEWRWSGQTADDSPLYDIYTTGKVVGCCYLPPVASVALNSFLYKDAVHLAELARRLGRPADTAHFQARARAIQKQLFAICYVPKEKRFWDFDHSTGRHRKIKNFYMFWPLYAGLDVPEATARDLIETVLLDPRQFFGPIPFPSVAYDEPAYEANGYWRGKSWPQISYWLLEMLVRYGYVKEAKEAARRILACGSATNGFLENLTSQPAASDPFFRPDQSSRPDYNWGSAAFYLIGTGHYLKANCSSSSAGSGMLGRASTDKP